jgi:DNA replication and repair protein RecF
VHLAHLRLRDFRNYARLDADFTPGFHLLLGDNAQGKTNILETTSNRYLPLPARLCYI